MSDHDTQRLNALTLSLSSAGIGTNYHRRKLAEVAPELVPFASDPGNVREGNGLTIVGTAQAYDATILMARAMHLQSVPSLVVPLRRMVKWLEHDLPEVDRLRDVKALFITGFHEDMEMPLTGRERQNAEELITERIDNKQAIFAHVERSVVRGGWWTETLVRRLARVNQTVVVK